MAHTPSLTLMPRLCSQSGVCGAVAEGEQPVTNTAQFSARGGPPQQRAGLCCGAAAPSSCGTCASGLAGCEREGGLQAGALRCFRWHVAARSAAAPAAWSLALLSHREARHPAGSPHPRRSCLPDCRKNNEKFSSLYHGVICITGLSRGLAGPTRSQSRWPGAAARREVGMCSRQPRRRQPHPYRMLAMMVYRDLLPLPINGGTSTL